jgi:hypothetical protein
LLREGLRTLHMWYLMIAHLIIWKVIYVWWVALNQLLVIKLIRIASNRVKKLFTLTRVDIWNVSHGLHTIRIWILCWMVVSRMVLLILVDRFQRLMTLELHLWISLHHMLTMRRHPINIIKLPITVNPFFIRFDTALWIDQMFAVYTRQILRSTWIQKNIFTKRVHIVDESMSTKTINLFPVYVIVVVIVRNLCLRCMYMILIEGDILNILIWKNPLDVFSWQITTNNVYIVYILVLNGIASTKLILVIDMILRPCIKWIDLRWINELRFDTLRMKIF